MHVFSDKLKALAAELDAARADCAQVSEQLNTAKDPDERIRLTIMNHIAEQARLDARMAFDGELGKYMASCRTA